MQTPGAPARGREEQSLRTADELHAERQAAHPAAGGQREASQAKQRPEAREHRIACRRESDRRFASGGQGEDQLAFTEKRGQRSHAGFDVRARRCNGFRGNGQPPFDERGHARAQPLPRRPPFVGHRASGLVRHDYAVQVVQLAERRRQLELTDMPPGVFQRARDHGETLERLRFGLRRVGRAAQCEARMIRHLGRGRRSRGRKSR